MDILDKIEAAIKPLSDNRMAWLRVCDILTSMNPVNDVLATNCPSVDAYIKSVYLPSMQIAQVIHTMETVPVYIVVAKAEDGKLIILSVPTDRGDMNTAVFFSRKEAQEMCDKAVQQSNGLEFRTVRIPFLILVDDRNTFLSESAQLTILLCDPRPEKEVVSLSKYDVMSMILDASHTLRCDFASDVYLSEMGRHQKIENKKLSPMAQMTSGARKRKLPVS